MSLYQAGNIKHRVIIQKSEKARDGFGAVKENWIDFKSLWAEVYDRSGIQVFATNQIKNEKSTRVRIRFRDDIDESMRVIFRGKPYDIQSVLDVSGDRKFLELMCAEGRRDG